MHFLSFKGIMRKQIKQPGYQCLFLFLYSTEMKLLQLIQTTTDLMMLMLRDGYFPFKLIWLQLKCVLQPWTGPADISCTYGASSDPPTCTWRAWTVKESVKILLYLASLHTKQISWFWGVTGQIFHWSSEMVSTQKKKSGREPCVAPAQRQPRSWTQTDVTH